MNIFKYFKKEVATALAALAEEGKVPHSLPVERISCEPPREASHGDVSTNAAMVLCKEAGMKPRTLADLIAAKMQGHGHVVEAEVAGPGFINLRLDNAFWHNRLKEMLRAGEKYGLADIGHGERVNVEYVSANPTGPMHVGHGRGAVFGDVLANLLQKTGYHVTREYYLNDAGAQVLALARSLYQRYRVARGVLSEDDYEALREAGEVEYGGDYLVPVAEAITEDKWLDAPEEQWLPAFRDLGVAAMVDLIKGDLAGLGVKHDLFRSERVDLIESGKVDEAFKHLQDLGLIYEGILEPPKGKTPDDWEPRPQVLFRATQFGDETDRPLKKSDGSWTYFASDIAYHWDKYRRGFANQIDVWGADHGGYVKRVQAAVKAVTEGKGDLDVKLCNMVKLLDNGEPVKMSKRAGTFVKLSDVVDRVGKDVVRFIMLTRRNDQNLDFDLTKVTEQSRDNPVFYVQYAHARIKSILRHAASEVAEVDLSLDSLVEFDLSHLTDPAELALIKVLAGWPRLVESAAEAHEPHRLAYFLNDVAGAFHGLWNKGNEDAQLRFLIPAEPELTAARLALVSGVAAVIASGLGVFGVEPLDEMR